MTIFTQQKERIPEEEQKKREQRIGVKVPDRHEAGHLDNH